MTQWLAGLRREGDIHALAETDTHADPFEQFRQWLGEAHASGLLQPNAMTISTTDADGAPDARMVLLKALDDRGFVFYTHRTSPKGVQLAARPLAALTFFWDVLERQVRIRGRVEWVTDAESDEYFASRPRGSQIGARVSPQSQIIDGRESLEQAVAAVTRDAGDAPIVRPATWGGYRVLPTEWEFWQGRPSRLHDRIRYRPDGHGAWRRDRLAP